ncbi:MAG: glutathione S-transferase family protein [Zhengella sp.]|uniref:glutathione S-transferase family protein n=1 Tax=Zhengella sp. TaxID=2282762 RepID=UPI001D942C12|nr:glutathione S-transferase family protein [Notoacmeibacter sp.]MCC0027455.1 glutathione S-transferase family protein [Brucellaceae bacterium]
MLTLYSMPSSGNSYKVRLLLAKLGMPFRHVAAEYGSGVTTSARFRALNPHGRVPLVQFEDGRLLSESNAILLYLSEGTRFLPDDRFARAKVHQWMFWEQNSHEATIAVRAAILCYDHRAGERRPEILDPLLEAGHRNLAVMETQLEKTPFLVGGTISAADLALYAYTHSAGTRGGFDLARFPAIVAWLARVEADAPHVPLDWLGDNPA